MNGAVVIRLLMALTILVSAFLRPPGTMLVLEGDTITYELCTGGEVETVTIALGGDTQEKRDLGCDFFAAQVAALPFVLPDVAPTDVEAHRFVAPVARAVLGHRQPRHLYAPRAPPVVI